MSPTALKVVDLPSTAGKALADTFAVLGPLQVWAGGRPVPLGTPAQRVLLAALVLRAGEVVSVDTLVDALWGARPPGSAANLIQVYVTRLRALLEPGRRRGEPPRLLLTRAPGYCLAIAPEQVDARRFERLIAEARGATPRVAAARLREALGLWRGEVLADVADYRFVAGEQARLVGLRQAALEARVDADLELGRHAELIPELEALVADDPLWERAWGQLMVAHYRAGHQARALAAYESVRRVLADELGLDPSPALQDLERAILRQDPALRPPPRSGAPNALAAGNLPAPLTSFVGREAELRHLARLLETSRLVTIVGVGGGGKTRLALQTAAALSARFNDGVWLVDLAPVEDQARVPLALAALLNLRDDPGRPMVDTLADYLRRAQALIVLDNCEHVVETCAELAAALLRACPGVRVLATSQEALAVPGEVAWVLPPLSPADAVALFHDRAVSGGHASPETEPFVTQICGHLDGIPLAIELAAARLQTLSVRQIAERLDDRFQLLSQVRRGIPARHRTLSAMVDWSYDLLSERERALFERLSVFAGGFTLDAVEAIDLADDTVGVLGRLVDKSLVLRVDVGSGSARYRLLETLRQYGHQRLERCGGTDGARARHAAYYLALAEEAVPHLAGPDSREWLDRLDVERANLRAALTWSFGRGDVTVGVRMVLAAWWLWSVRGPLGEGRKLVEMAWERGRDAPPQVRMGLLFGAGFLAASQCEYGEAVAAGRPCLALAQEHADDQFGALARLLLGAAFWISGDYEHAHTLLGEAVAIARRLGRGWHLAIMLTMLGRLAADRGDPTGSAGMLDESVQLATEVGEPWVLSTALGFRAEVASQQHDDDLAATLAGRAASAALAVGNIPGIAGARMTLAVVAERRGDTARASRLLLESLAACRQIRCRRGTAMCLEALAYVAGCDRPAATARLLGAASALRAEIGAPVLATELARYERHLATVRAALGSGPFHHAWAAGQALEIEEACAEAAALASPVVREEIAL